MLGPRAQHSHNFQNTERKREILITRAAKLSMDGRMSAICCHRDRVINSVPILFELFSHNPSVCGAVGHDDDGDHW